MRRFGKMYPNAGYGGMFRQWLRNPECQAYNSFGNGSAMRVSSVAWLYNDIDAVRHAARLSAEVTHNHPEGIKGAEATASAIFLARTGHSKTEIKEYICLLYTSIDFACALMASSSSGKGSLAARGRGFAI